MKTSTSHVSLVFVSVTPLSGLLTTELGYTTAWRRAWEHVVPFFVFAPGVRKMIYTTNAVEALHRSLRKIIKTVAAFQRRCGVEGCFTSPSKNAGLRWRRGLEWTAAMASSPFSSAHVFRDRRDEPGDANPGDHRANGTAPPSNPGGASMADQQAL